MVQERFELNDYLADGTQCIISGMENAVIRRRHRALQRKNSAEGVGDVVPGVATVAAEDCDVVAKANERGERF